MVIKASSSRQIDALVADLGSDRTVKREAAIARLTVLGGRAVERLVAFVNSSNPASARVAALRALEGMAEPRALDSILRATAAADQAVAIAAISAARPYLRGSSGATAVDRLTTIALDSSRDDRVRVAAVEAIRLLEPSTVEPLLLRLRSDAPEAVRAAATTTPADPAELLGRAAAHGLPEDPNELAAAIVLAGDAVPAPALLRIIERIHEQERNDTSGRRADWIRARGRVHLALAERDSRIAVYDLRESLEHATTPLPAEFLAALAKAGDASCLEAIASGYARAATAGKAGWWRERLAESFREIVRREKMTARHAVMKRVQKRWPAILRSAQ